ncbi:MAG: NAD(+) diphosphatase [Deltaproteobacteria bacterium]|nr:NAD(+) diphosphatase [Deltaproteobacteria bacterium]
MGFIPQNKPPAEVGAKDPLYFIINDQEIIVKWSRDKYWIPSETDISEYDFDLKRTHFVGSWNDQFCYASEFPKNLSIPDALQSIPLRDAFTQFSSHEIQAISLAKQILTWDRDFRFCGRCGQPTVELPDERAKVCKRCGSTNYPRLSPSIIVSVVKKDQLLLARSARFPKGMYSVLAGFVEPGETLEECVKREVMEEVGIEVQNIRYFGSQNWPFPHSLMIGFTADYFRGEIGIDNDEIVDARWFTASELPKIPGSYSIARKMIDHFRSSSLLENRIKL